jgi:hypothetical protein
MKATLRIWGFLSVLLLLASCAAPRHQPLELENRRFSIAPGSHAFRGGRPLVEVAQGDRKFPAMADTGATRSLVAVPDAAHRAAARASGTEWIGAQGNPLEGVPVTLWINDTPHPGFAVAASKAPWSAQFPMLLGLDVLRTHRVVFNYAGRSTDWGQPPPGRRPIRDAPALFVLPSTRSGEWIILDTGAVNSYYLNASGPLAWQGDVTSRLRRVDASAIARDMQSGGKRVGVIGMDRQRQAFRTFAVASGELTAPSP